MEGVLKFYDRSKGYGFIVPEARVGGDVYLPGHVFKTLGVDRVLGGERVEFEGIFDRSGMKMRATSIKFASSST